jgi:GNAT superfamily N-acetyltransferase
MPASVAAALHIYNERVANAIGGNGFRTYEEIIRDLGFAISYGYNADGSLWTNFNIGVEIGTPWYQRGALWDLGNFSTGVTDEFTFGLTRAYRNWRGWESDADETSSAYNGGGWAGFAASFLVPGDGELNALSKAARFGADERALIDLAKAAKRTGIGRQEAQTLLNWAKEYGLPFRGPEAHPGRGFGSNPHIHIGPVNHIPVKL